MSVYTVEETDDEFWSVVDVWAGSRGCVVLSFQDEKEAEFYCNLMNLVYHRVMDDVKRKLNK